MIYGAVPPGINGLVLFVTLYLAGLARGNRKFLQCYEKTSVQAGPRLKQIEKDPRARGEYGTGRKWPVKNTANCP